MYFVYLIWLYNKYIKLQSPLAQFKYCTVFYLSFPWFPLLELIPPSFELFIAINTFYFYFSYLSTCLISPVRCYIFLRKKVRYVVIKDSTLYKELLSEAWINGWMNGRKTDNVLDDILWKNDSEYGYRNNIIFPRPTHNRKSFILQVVVVEIHYKWKCSY